MTGCEMKGFLNFLCLRMISQHPMSGDCIRCEIERRKGAKPSPGTIYPVLKELKQDGFIREVKDDSRNKVYEITPKGKKELTDATKKFIALFFDLKEEFMRCNR